MYNSTNLTKCIEKNKTLTHKTRKDGRIRKFRTNPKSRRVKLYKPKISIQYAPMDTDVKIYHLLSFMKNNLGLSIVEPLYNMPTEFNTQFIVTEMFKYFTSYFTVEAVKDKNPKYFKVKPIVNANWESHILLYPKIYKSFGLERWFHYLVYIKPGILDDNKALIYKKKYIEIIKLEDIYLPLNNYEDYTEYEMYNHWIQCLTKNPTLLIDDKRAKIPILYFHSAVFKSMQDNLHEWLHITTTDKERWFSCNKYYDKIQNSIGLESLLHYVIYKQSRILSKAKFKEYKDTYHRVSAKLAFKACYPKDISLNK